VTLFNGWRFHNGDESSWANPDFDDSDWEVAYTRLIEGESPESGWNGKGWFRIRFEADSQLIGKPLAFIMYQAGASEVYLDGKLLYKYGIVGSSVSDERSYDDRNPKTFVLEKQKEHTLAVKYSNYLLDYYNHQHVSGGFLIKLGNLNGQIVNRVDQMRNSSVTQMIFTSLAAAFALMHFFLFLFYPKFKENLYYAICMLGFAVIIYSDYQTVFTLSVAEILGLVKIANIGKYIAIVFGILMVYSMAIGSIPKRAWVFIFAGSALAVWTYIQPFDIGNKAGDVFLVVSMVEMIRTSLQRKKTKNDRGWIIFTGFILLCITLSYQLLVDYNVITPVANIRSAYLYGALALSLSMSIYLSQKFANINKNLEYQIVQVKELSEQALEQERFMKEREIQQRLLEADNQRKTKELEDARQLQLSMLPDKIPTLPYLKIAAFMKTANEVGGDYYDFYLEEGKKLTCVVGDATGHGLRAGTMVTAAKSLFNEFASYDDIKTAFEKFTRAFKNLNFEKLYMAMLMVKIEDYRLKAASAGMPPPLIFRSGTGQTETLILKGMPLGCFENFPYKTFETVLKPGDTVLLMSDGFPELFNEKDEVFDYNNAKEAFARYASLEPEEIIEKLIAEGEAWSGRRPQADDITFVVIKVMRM